MQLTIANILTHTTTILGAVLTTAQAKLKQVLKIQDDAHLGKRKAGESGHEISALSAGSQPTMLHR